MRQIQALFALHGDQKVSEETGGYCTARKRLPLDTLQRLRVAAAAAADKASQLWYGWNVKLLDGTSLSAPDTKKNQRAYPQPGGQKPGCGFPLIKRKGSVPHIDTTFLFVAGRTTGWTGPASLMSPRFIT